MFGQTLWNKAVDNAKSHVEKDILNPIIPDHYGGPDNPYEARKVINAWELGFSLGNVLKYISRHKKKGNAPKTLDLGAFTCPAHYKLAS